MRHLIDITDLSVQEVDELIATAEDIIQDPAKYAEVCRHKKLATLFFEPSTRTRLSFEAAMLDLGGSTLGFSEAQSSSAAGASRRPVAMPSLMCRLPSSFAAAPGRAQAHSSVHTRSRAGRRKRFWGFCNFFTQTVLSNTFLDRSTSNIPDLEVSVKAGPGAEHACFIKIFPRHMGAGRRYRTGYQ